nr:MAG TPA: hypothetical protein [Caudoviricetes sp.]
MLETPKGQSAAKSYFFKIRDVQRLSLGSRIKN